MARFSVANENLAIAAVIVPGVTYYLSLHSGDPGQTGASEVANSGGSTYARQPIVFGAAVAGVETSTTAQTFTNMPAEAGGCPYLGIWSAASAGTYECGGISTGISVAIPAGATIPFAIGAVPAAIS